MRGARVWGALLVLGLLTWLLCLGLGDAHRAWRALLVNSIYFTALAGGMVVWSAVITLARGGNWLNESLKRPALAAISFAPVCLAAFLLLWLGRYDWAPWISDASLHNAAWLNARFLFSRDALALVLFWWIAARYANAARYALPKARAGWLVFVYCAVYSLLGFDLVMALDPHWYSWLFGGYFFITSMYIAVAAWTFIVLLQDPPVDEGRRKDLAKLVVTFSLLSTYMMFCQLLPIWYENLPEEVRFVIPRLRNAPWRWVSLALLASVYLGPLVLLLPSRFKGSIRYLRLITLGLLVGMWLERWWLVTPTLGGRLVIGPAEIGMTAAFAAAFVLAMQLHTRRIPVAGAEFTP
jgi:hypothetical protein